MKKIFVLVRRPLNKLDDKEGQKIFGIEAESVQEAAKILGAHLHSRKPPHYLYFQIEELRKNPCWQEITPKVSEGVVVCPEFRRKEEGCELKVIFNPDELITNLYWYEIQEFSVLTK
jgi:hypothetical protein